MARGLVGLFFIAHGLAHLAIWLPRDKSEGPYNLNRSWLLGIVGLDEVLMWPLAIVLAVVAAIG